MSQSTSEKVKGLLTELAFENPAPEERWIRNENFDPPFGRTELNSASRRRLIELDCSSDNHIEWRFRFTSSGRDFVKNSEKAAS